MVLESRALLPPLCGAGVQLRQRLVSVLLTRGSWFQLSYEDHPKPIGLEIFSQYALFLQSFYQFLRPIKCHHSH